MEKWKYSLSINVNYIIQLAQLYSITLLIRGAFLLKTAIVFSRLYCKNAGSPKYSCNLRMKMLLKLQKIL